MACGHMSIKSIAGRVIAGVGVVIVGGMLLMALALFAARPWNDFFLWKMEYLLLDMGMHPRDSEVIKTYRFFGSRYTNTSECTFAVGQWRVSKIGPDALREIYTDQIITMPLSIKSAPLGFALIEEKSLLTLEDPPDGWHTIIQEQMDGVTDGYTHYLLYLSIPGRSWLGDERCLEGEAIETETRDLTRPLLL